MTPTVIEYRLQPLCGCRWLQLLCSCCNAGTRAVLPSVVESGGYGPRLSALVGTLGSTYHLSHQKIQSLLDAAFGARINTGGISCIRRRLNKFLEQPVSEAHRLQGQPLLQAVDEVLREAVETSYRVGNADVNNP